MKKSRQRIFDVPNMNAFSPGLPLCPMANISLADLLLLIMSLMCISTYMQTLLYTVISNAEISVNN